MKVLWVLPFQLHLKNVIKAPLDENDVILLLEPTDFYRIRQRHKQWVVSLMSATRHAVKTFEDLGYKVLFKEGNSALDLLKDIPMTELHLIKSTDYDVSNWVKNITDSLEIPSVFYDDHQFILNENECDSWVKKPYKMDGFYRLMRKYHNILMDQNKPLGGKWSYDGENRKKLPKDVVIPKRISFKQDEITQEVIQKVIQIFPEYVGTTNTFDMPVTHEDALVLLDDFLKNRLKTFGDYQDALVHENREVSHSLISNVLNMGLLDPLTVIKKAENTMNDGMPLNSVEGFIRQILGWREYIRAIYVLEGPNYQNLNHFNNDRNLPHYYWDKNTKMACMKDAITDVMDHGYAHHIKRLMVLGNFANLAGITPIEVNDWFNESFIDAYDYVVTPNVIGMALHADGGLMATKPYVSSGAYIHKMGDHCQHCYYDVNQKTGEKACPFNVLYWDFIDRNQEVLSNNPRMQIPLSVLKKMDETKKSAFRKDALRLLKNIESL